MIILGGITEQLDDPSLAISLPLCGSQASMGLVGQVSVVDDRG